MKYIVTLGGHDRDVEITERDGVLWVSLDGEERPVEVSPVPGGFTVLWDGQVHDVLVGWSGDRAEFSLGPFRGTAVVLGPRSAARLAKGGMAGKDRDILAPMPGRVVRVLVKEGQAVVPGEPVLIIEAMKMENELRAVVGGTVSAVHAKAGDGVERGALLVAIGEGE